VLFALKFVAALVLICAISLLTFLFLANKMAERSFFGRYHLINPAGCRNDVQDSHLVIRDNGTFDQDVLLKSGSIETIENGHWNYDKTTQRTSFSKSLISAETSFPTVHLHPAKIIVNPSGDCWYQHPK